MIPKDFITEWRKHAPWVQDVQVEQDLVICRALVDIFSRPALRRALAFRGGTALYKLHVRPAARQGHLLARARALPYANDCMRAALLALLAVLAAGCSKMDVSRPPPLVQAPSAAAAVPPPPPAAVVPPSRAATPSEIETTTVTNIGVHIGGGPNDAATKAPVRDSIAPHFKYFGKCYELVEVKKRGDVGVDLLIEPEGGAARVSNPRVLGLRGDAFKECVVAEFGKVRFQKMRHGKTMASYSLRFAPKDPP